MSSTSLLILNSVLAFMMFGIALSLKLSDFKRVVNMPRAAFVGLLAQFVLLPLLSFLMTTVFPVPAEVALGIILVGSCPGGSFSNVMTYLAKGNTALSVSMTAVSSSAAAFATPANFLLYTSLNPETAALIEQIAVPPEQVFQFVVFVLIIPLGLGLSVGRFFPQFAQRSEQSFRALSLLMLLGFVAIALASNWPRFVDGITGFTVLVVVHNLLALMLGYAMARVAKLPERETRAVTLEVGIQNSGLALGVIFSFYSSLGGMAIIAAAWGIWHLITGLALSMYWARNTRRG